MNAAPFRSHRKQEKKIIISSPGAVVRPSFLHVHEATGVKRGRYPSSALPGELIYPWCSIYEAFPGRVVGHGLTAKQQGGVQEPGQDGPRCGWAQRGTRACRPSSHAWVRWGCFLRWFGLVLLKRSLGVTAFCPENRRGCTLYFFILSFLT